MERQPDLILYGVDLNKPAIYAWKRGKQWLYIGITELGIIRRLKGHHIIGSIGQFRDGDRIDVWHINLPRINLITLEKRLILKYKPKYNKQSAKNSIIAIRLTLEEKVLLTRAATACNMTVSEWFRGVVLSAARKECKRRGW